MMERMSITNIILLGRPLNHKWSFNCLFCAKKFLKYGYEIIGILMANALDKINITNRSAQTGSRNATYNVDASTQNGLVANYTSGKNIFNAHAKTNEITLSAGRTFINKEKTFDTERTNPYNKFRNDGEANFFNDFKTYTPLKNLYTGGADTVYGTQRASGGFEAGTSAFGIGAKYYNKENGRTLSADTNVGLTRNGFNFSGNISLGKEVSGYKTSDRGVSVYGGVTADFAGVRAVFNVETVRNGMKRTWHIGEMLTSAITLNPVGLVKATLDTIRKEPINAATKELILPDNVPDLNARKPIFEKDSNKITKEGREDILKMVDEAKKNPDAKIEIGSYIDKGLGFSKSKRIQLSEERQQLVKNLLVENGIDESKIVIGHSKAEKDSSKVIVQDNATNLQLSSEKDIVFSNGAEFSPLLASPKALADIKRWSETTEFKAVVKGKGKTEETLAANLTYMMMLGGKTADEALAYLKSNYEKGATIVSSFGLSFNEMRDVAMGQFAEYAKTKGIDKKEQERLAEFAVKQAEVLGKDYKESDVVALYDRMNEKGMSFSNIDSAKKEFVHEFDKNNEFLKGNKVSREERKHLENIAFTEYLYSEKPGNVDAKSYMKQYAQGYTAGNAYTQDAFSRQEARTRLANNDNNTSYMKQVKSETKHAVRSNPELKAYFESPEFKAEADKQGISVSKLRSKTLEKMVHETYTERLMSEKHISSEELVAKRVASLTGGEDKAKQQETYAVNLDNVKQKEEPKQKQEIDFDNRMAIA